MDTDKPAKQRIYCAIYTRKSTAEGLDQDFTSLDAQREAAENYIASQKHEGWVALQESYNDGGFTGANLERPGLQKLLADIQAHKIDCVTVYKVDRLSRSLMDFAQLLEFFDQHHVTFVSVTQAFNTNTSMGRLTLNILLSFAQFERELISERTRDKMGAARKRGQWLGGRPPLGYDCAPDAKKLLVNPAEAQLIQHIFDLYLQGNSLLQVAQRINAEGHRTKRATAKNGRVFGGITFGITHIQFILTNVLYLGKVSYGGQIYAGQQAAIIEDETFKQVQAKLKQNRVVRRATKNIDCTGLLSQLLRCRTCDHVMFHTYTIKHTTHKYRYYVCSNAQKRGYRACPTKSVNAQAIEDATIDCLRRTLAANRPKDEETSSPEREAITSPIWETLPPPEQRRILQALLTTVDYEASQKTLGLTLAGSTLRLAFTVEMPPVRPLQTWRKEQAIAQEPKLRRQLLLAHQIERLLREGRATSPKQAAAWLGLHHVQVDQLLNLLLLAPAIQAEILSTENPRLAEIPAYHVRRITNAVDWHEQTALWQALLKPTAASQPTLAA